MSKSMIESLHALARAVPSDALEPRQPLHVLTGEATDVARFFERYYAAERAPKTKVVLRPGLESVGDKRLPPQTAKHITLLVDEVQAAQTRYQLAAEAPADDAELTRGRFVLSELTAALEFLFDDGVEDERDAQLARVHKANDDTSTANALAGALSDYAGLAEPYRDELDGLGGFEVALIDEAKPLAKAIRKRSARGKGDAKQQSAAALEWRNRLAAVLAAKVASVRSCARFVFRNHPEIRREAASTYERRARAARRRATAKAGEATPADAAK
jgi:hypothetical protein